MSAVSLPSRLKIEKKSHILQFVPSRLMPLTEVKKIEIDGKKIKTVKIIDAIHTMVAKHYYKEKSNFNLSSEILRETLGTFYNYVIKYLKDEGLITLVSDYCAGKKSRTYQLDKTIFKEQMFRWKNTDKVIVKKWKNKILKFYAENFLKIAGANEWVMKQIVNDLWSVQIDLEGARAALDKEYADGEITDVAYWKNISSIEAIEDESLFFKLDDYGRLHTNFTVLKKLVRSNYLTIEGEKLAECDIKNSQPIFLLIMLKEWGFNNTNPEEYDRFYETVKSGNIYEELMGATGNKLSRGKAKKLIYKVFFGQNKKNKENVLFKSLYPNIWNWIVNYKRAHNNYKILSYELQSRESKLVFGQICYRIKKEMPAIKLFTVHDSIFFPEKYKERVEKIFNNQVDLLFA